VRLPAPEILLEPDDLFGVPLLNSTVLLVDSSEINRRILKAMLHAEDARFNLLEAARPSQALEILNRQEVDLVIADFLLPEMSGPEFVARIRGQRRTRFIPVLILTSVQGVDHEIAGLSSGADDFLVKPLSPSIVRARVAAVLRHKAAIDSLEEVESILFTLAQAVEQRDRYTGEHCQRLATYSVAIGLKLGLKREELLALHRGGYLHDIGKISIPDAILFKEALLTDDEWSVMRSHTLRGEEICRPMKSLELVLPIIRSHHERWDGSGYPDGLKGEEIPLLARILQVVDIYDALITARPYKPALSHEEAAALLQDEAARGWRDPQLIRVLAELLEEARRGGSPAPGFEQSLDSMRRETAGD
jgi:putative two-component system response regulator